MTPEDFKLIEKISARSKDSYDHWARDEVGPVEQTEFFLELELAHSYCPLDLKALLKAKDLDFAKEICGIHQNINRKTFAKCD